MAFVEFAFAAYHDGWILLWPAFGLVLFMTNYILMMLAVFFLFLFRGVFEVER